ncbi:hypothetical protein LJC46_02245 [Desulfovibrio sp. OttesenSCG-928-G15]|nr:hypothetical protein [Desulfovibrio sp. OttesenSCG-928-G15]
MKIIRDDYEIARVKKWAEESNPERHYFVSDDYDSGYAEGIIDILAWLTGEESRAPDDN